MTGNPCYVSVYNRVSISLQSVCRQRTGSRQPPRIWETSESFQLVGTPLCVIWCSRDSGLLKQLQEVLALLRFPVSEESSSMMLFSSNHKWFLSPNWPASIVPARQRFYFSGSGPLLTAADSSDPSEQTPQILYTIGPVESSLSSETAQAISPLSALPLTFSYSKLLQDSSLSSQHSVGYLAQSSIVLS